MEYDECEHGVPGGNDCIECLRLIHRDEVKALETRISDLESRVFPSPKAGLTLERLLEPVVMDCKRLHLPFRLVEACPACGQEAILDLSAESYLSYPVPGKPITKGFYCDECGEEWDYTFVMDVTLEVRVSSEESGGGK